MVDSRWNMYYVLSLSNDYDGWNQKFSPWPPISRILSDFYALNLQNVLFSDVCSYFVWKSVLLVLSDQVVDKPTVGVVVSDLAIVLVHLASVLVLVLWRLQKHENDG